LGEIVRIFLRKSAILSNVYIDFLDSFETKVDFCIIGKNIYSSCQIFCSLSHFIDFILKPIRILSTIRRIQIRKTKQFYDSRLWAIFYEIEDPNILPHLSIPKFARYTWLKDNRSWHFINKRLSPIKFL